MEEKPPMPDNFFDDDDPFKLPRAAMERMQKMVRGLMSDPFGNMTTCYSPWSNWTEEENRPRDRGRNRNRADPELIPMKSMTAGDAKVHSFSSRAVVSMTSGEDGKPVVYREATSTVSAPGGIREMRKALCDGRSGIKRIQIGRQIGDRGMVIEKEQNLVSGESEEKHDYINMDEEELDSFTREFERRTRSTKQKSYLKPRPRALSRD
ncbi:myeloid leukemia factor-like [Ischnura elegans]|uniref:myeloid leukemia factor-like n=1 Tax=Ischnura elegans TaxID=197161 RepID=UPI001ED8ABE6|nr:myeloid leukemia factor-like [Ischnura elegans]